MNTAKELFQKDKETRDKLAAVTQSDWFKQCLAVVKAELFDDPSVTRDQLDGARKMESVLLQLPEPEPHEEPIPGPGLHHDTPLPKSRQSQSKPENKK